MQHYVSDIDSPYVGRQSSSAPAVPGTFGRRNNQRRYVTDVDGIRAVSAFTAGGAATAITMSGASGGVVSVASTNFTIGANGVITGTVIVTPSDGGGGGTFTPASVNISAGSPTATFTYTPSSTGAKTISVTNNGGLTNPANITYTVSSAAATAVTFTGPTSGTVSTPSTNFTAGANGSITGTITVTPSAGGGGGSFSPATVNISAGSPTATFTYTPASTGAKTLSVTNNGGLTNPSTITYTVSGAAATAVTLSGPSSGTVGSASTNFTVAANGVISGTVIVTPSSGGGGGTFSPVTVSISAGSPTATFVYTPVSTGVKTISVTNDGGLTNPGTLAYTSNAVGATSTTLSGPSSGTTGVASTAFTVGANGSITGTLVVTPNDAGNGGTFSPATLNISSGSPTGTFTYTPGSVGTKSIGITNSGGLSNAPNISYTSSAAPSLTSYPAYPQYLSSKERHIRGRRAVRATNGAVKVRTFFTNEKRVFDVVHMHLTSAEKADWDAFYTANVNNVFSFVWSGDGQTYSVVFDDQDPAWQPMDGIWWGITQGLLQV